jgi:hypothetical protein
MNEIVVLISGIVSFIALMCFFIMGSNIGAIRKQIEKLIKEQETEKQIVNYSKAYNDGELLEYIGKKDDAIFKYKEAHYLISKLIKKIGASVGANEKSHLEMIETKLKSLGAEAKQIEIPGALQSPNT